MSELIPDLTSLPRPSVNIWRVSSDAQVSNSTLLIILHQRKQIPQSLSGGASSDGKHQTTLISAPRWRKIWVSRLSNWPKLTWDSRDPPGDPPGRQWRMLVVVAQRWTSAHNDDNFIYVALCALQQRKFHSFELSVQISTNIPLV